MNILYIGPYRQQDGWGEASRQLIQSLVRTGHNITIRYITMGNSHIPGNLPTPLCDLEKNNLKSYDMVIQHVLPPLMEYDSRFGKNVGVFFSETASLQHTGWPIKCNLMDEIWVSSDIEKANLIDSGVTTKVKKVNIPANVDKYSQRYDKLSLPVRTNDFNFYFIGEYIQRKNIPAAVLAFQLAFHKSEPVNLVIKTNKSGHHPIQVHNDLKAEIDALKKTVRMYQNPSNYKEEMILTQYLSEKEMYGLHQSCHCFVMPSRGEAWSLPAFDAMGFGNTPIVTDNTGMVEFVSNVNGWVVHSNRAPVLAADPPISTIYTARETWQNIDILELSKAMREAYVDRDMYQQKKIRSKDSVHQFSYEKIAEQINDS